jgi:hypothetical protein
LFEFLETKLQETKKLTMWNKTFSYLKLWKNNLGKMKENTVDHAEQGLNT